MSTENWQLRFSLIIFFHCMPMVFLGQTKVHETGILGEFYTIEKAYENSTIDGYNVYIPNSCNENSKPCPLIVFLQGSSSVGKTVSSIYSWALPKLLKEIKNPNLEFSRLIGDTFVIVMPHLREGQYYENEDAITSILEEVDAKFNIDANRVYLTGLSRGGHGTWGLASRLPGVFAAIAPICGRPNGITHYENFKEMPILAIHNLGDDVVPIESSIEIINHLESQFGYAFNRADKLRTISFETDSLIFLTPNKKKHDAWTQAYKSPDLYRWLLRFELRQ